MFLLWIYLHVYKQEWQLISRHTNIRISAA